MKKYFGIFCATLLLGACAKQIEDNPQIAPVKDGIKFAATFTKVSTDQGVNTWEANDIISVFSVVNGAAAGASIGTNIQYKTDEGGASVTFSPVEAAAPGGDKYYAYYKYAPTYPSAYNANTDTGFPGAASGEPVADYRYVPVYINSGATVDFNTETGVAKCTNSFQSFYAVGVPPANENDPVQLHFKPILPLLEFDLYGYGEFKTLVLTFTDKATDAFAQKNWLSAKGIFDLSTGEHTVTNYSGSAYHKLTITLKEGANSYVTLQGDKPMKFMVPVGFFNITKGLTLTFTTKDGATVVRKIWADKTVCSFTTDGSPKHLRQGIKFAYINASVPSVAEFPADGGDSEAFNVVTNSSWEVKSKPEWITVNPATGAEGTTSVVLTAAANTGAARSDQVVFQVPDGPECSVAVSQAKYQAVSAGYYSVDLSAITFASSYIYDVKNASDQLIARITREFIGAGATANVRLCVAYPMLSSGKPDYEHGLVLDNSGSVNAWTMDPGEVEYIPGNSTALTTIWVKDDGTEIYTYQPDGNISTASVSPYILQSPSGQNHATVKIGSQIWTAEGYKTTKLGDGTTDISLIGATDAVSKTEPNYISTTVNSEEVYLYNFVALMDGENEKLSPAGWKIPTLAQWKTDLNGFLGGGTLTYNNLSFDKAQMFDRDGMCKKNTAAPAALTFRCFWGNYSPAANKWVILLVKSDGSVDKSSQNDTNMFEVRLIQDTKPSN